MQRSIRPFEAFRGRLASFKRSSPATRGTHRPGDGPPDQPKERWSRLFDGLLQHSDVYRLLTAGRRVDSAPIVLRHRRVFIFPTLHGFTFGAALVMMVIGSTNYSLSLGFALTFLLAGISIVGLVNTFRNVIGLRITLGRSEPVFAGEDAQFIMHVENPFRYDRYSLEAVREGRIARFDVSAQGWSTVAVLAATRRRGWLDLGKVTVQGRYPLGLFRAWSPVRPDVQVLVYPHPEITPLPPVQAIPELGNTLDIGIGSEDFVALREYHLGDSPRHIAWKITARSDQLVTKQFSSRGSAELMFAWSALPVLFDVESRLSRLAGWIVQAEGSQASYGLSIPGTEIAPGRGIEHRDQCLKALALYDGGSARDSLNNGAGPLVTP